MVVKQSRNQNLKNQLPKKLFQYNLAQSRNIFEIEFENK